MKPLSTILQPSRPAKSPPPSRRASRGMMSLWTRTPMFRAERGPLLIQTLAICLARRAFAELHLVTDEPGARLAAMLGWQFSGVSTELEAMPPELEHIWALGKLVALIATTDDGTPVCQIDGDVLLFDPLPEGLLRSPLLAQSPDYEHYYYGEDMERGFAIAALPRQHRKFNAGLLGGGDVPLVRAAAYAALDRAERFRGCDLNGTTTSMIVEQAHLGVFADRCRARIGTLFSQPPAQLRYRHYAHLVGPAKRDPLLISECAHQLRANFPGAAARFAAGFPLVAALFSAPATFDSAVHSYV